MNHKNLHTILWKDQWLAGNEILHTPNQFTIRISFALEAIGVLSSLIEVFTQLCSLMKKKVNRDNARNDSACGGTGHTFF